MINTEGLSGGKKDEASKVDKNSPNTMLLTQPQRAMLTPLPMQNKEL